MKYKIVRAVQFEYRDNQKEQRQAERARLLALHLVRQLNERKEVPQHESKKQ